MTTLPLTLAVVLHLLGQEAPRPEAPEPPSAPARIPLATTPDPVGPAPGPSLRNAPASPPRLSRVTLRDGQVLRGFVVQQDAQHVVLELPDGNRMELAARTVERVEEESTVRIDEHGKIQLMDPNRTRYFYAPSAFMLHQGEAYFSQKELLFSSLNYGLTDHITLQAGAAVPLWFIKGGSNFIGGVKVGGSLGDRLHLAAGAQALVLPGVSSFGVAGLLFGSMTYGTPAAHVSLAVGVPFRMASTHDFYGGDIFTLSGNLRVGQQVALVTENWLIPSFAPWPPTLYMINSGGVRLFGERWAVDLGLVRVPDVGFPVPWVDVVYNLGG